MTNRESRTTSSPLAQLVLIKSPYLQLPHPVSLPYNYTPLPNSLDAIVQSTPQMRTAYPQPTTDFSQVVASVELSVKKTSALKSEHEVHVEKVKTWEEQIRDREVREKRRIAPGYLDTDQRLLVPTRVETPRIESPVTREAGGTQTEEETNTNSSTGELGKAFGNMGLSHIEF
jgi:hypothetical protein